MQDPKARKELKDFSELQQLTESYGTKMAYLIFYLRSLFQKDKNSRVIIFSQARQLQHDLSRHYLSKNGVYYILIFLQWDSLLVTIGNTLEENNITNVFVKGNVFVRNRAIAKFRVSHLYALQTTTYLCSDVTPRFQKQNQTRVIMLSLQNAASGTNLVEATHVILIDPVAGSKEEAVAIEAQAIGRAHRMGQNKQVRLGLKSGLSPSKTQQVV